MYELNATIDENREAYIKCTLQVSHLIAMKYLISNVINE